MPNITLSIDDDLLKSSREYAKTHDDSLNGLVRKLLSNTVAQAEPHWLDETFALMDRARARAGEGRWRREDLYDV